MKRILLMSQEPNKTNKEWGQWIRHQPEDWKNKHQKQSNKTSKGNAQAKPTSSLKTNANLAAVDTIDSDTE